MSHQLKFHKRAGSRASLASVGQMPVINEHGYGAMPRPPLRVPIKNPRRSLGPRITPPPAYMAGFAAPSPDELTTEYKYEGDDDETIVGQMTPPLESGQRNGDQSFQDSRQRRCRFILIIAGIMLVIVGLAVGLSLGLSNRSVTNGRGSRDDLGIPTGSFAFDTTLQNTTTACTSYASTWTCPPKDGAPAKFYWSIESFNSPPKYRVSSSDITLSPPFSNISMTLLDGSKESERLVFFFLMNKTVSRSISSMSNIRAAKCTYINTTFQATLWTRRVSGHSGNSRRQSGYSAWPGVVEIAEIKNATLGSPMCEDSQGQPIADVQAGLGTCECLYKTKQQ